MTLRSDKKSGFSGLNLRYAAIVLFVVSLPAASPEQGERELNLPEMERLALIRNPEMRVGRVELKIAEKKRKLAFSSYLPEIYAKAGYAYLDPPPGVKMELMPGVTLPLTFGKSNNYAYGLGLDYILFAGGQRQYGYRAAKLGEEAMHWLMRDTTRNTILRARRLYLETLLMKEMTDLSTEARDRAAQRLKDARNKLDAGSISRLAYLRVKTEASDTELLRQQAENRYAAILGEIRIFLDLKENETFKLVGQLEEFAKLPALLSQETLTSIKPDFTATKVANLRSQQAELNVKAKRGKFLPTLNGGVSYERVNPYLGQKKFGTDFQVKVGAKIPLFEGGRSVNEYREAQEESDKARILEETTRNEIQTRFALLTDRIATLRKEIETAKLSREQAQLARDATVVAQENGAATFRELADGELLLFRARVEYYKSVTAFLESVAEWERLGGGISGIFERLDGVERNESNSKLPFDSLPDEREKSD